MKEYLPILYRWVWLVVLGTLVAMVSSYLVFRYYTPWPPYEATATVIIMGDDTLGLDTMQAIRATYAELAGRRPVSQAVVDVLGLPMSADDLEELIKVNPVGQTRLLEISVTYNDAQLAATIANEVARQLGQVTLSTQATLIQTLAEAQVPTRPSLGSYIGIFIAAVTGFSLTSGVVILIEYLGGKIRTPQDVERNLRLPVLGTVQQSSHARGRGLFRLLRWHREPRSTASPASSLEPYRWICLSIDHTEDGPPQKLLITGPDALEGQSTFTTGLATAWAETDQKVVLVNAHLCCPVVSQWFGFSNDGSSSAPLEHDEHLCAQESERIASMEGAQPAAVLKPPEGIEPRAPKEGCVPPAHRPLLERIAEMGSPPLSRRARLILAWDNGADVRELQERVGYSRSSVYHWLREYRLHGFQIFAEQANTNSSESHPACIDSEGLVSGQEREQPPSPTSKQHAVLNDDVLNDLSRRADVMIVDGPPVLATPDAAALASKVDGILLVLGAGKTRIKATQETARILEVVGGRVLGVVLLSES